VIANQITDWRVVLQNETEEALRGFQVSEEIAGKRAFWTVDRLAPKGRVYLRETVAFSHRGRHALGPLRVITRFPFGLVQSALDLPGGQEVLVLPRLGQIKNELFKSWLSRVSRGEGKTRQRKPLASLRQANFHGLRQFRPGDSPRWIDWKSSARRDELIVREFEDDAPPKLILIVEAWLPMTPTVADHRSLEDILSLAGTICRDWSQDQTSSLQLIVVEQAVHSRKMSGSADHAWPLIEMLAPLKGTDKPAQLQSQLIGRTRQFADSIVVISSRANSPLAREAEQLYHRQVARIDSLENLNWYIQPLEGIGEVN
jgi:uncharacterized protein (DUF58 family)